jgi:hypothetical protein
MGKDQGHLLAWANDMSHRHTLALVVSLASLVGAVDRAVAGANPNFTLPLHAKVSQFEPCSGYLPVDCLSVRPTVQVETGQQVAIFLFVANYTQLAVIQTAFEVDPSWSFTFGLWDCQPGLQEFPPMPPFGPTSGTMIYAFNCLTGGTLAALGRMFFVAGTGCIGQVESTYPPDGIYALDCQQQVDQIFPDEPGQQARLGKVCVGAGGHDACDHVTPVAAATWGLIKATYR